MAPSFFDTALVTWHAMLQSVHTSDKIIAFPLDNLIFSRQKDLSSVSYGLAHVAGWGL